MKKILFIITFICFISPVFAENMEFLINESYLFFSDNSIENIQIFPAGILNYEITTDIFNTKKEVVFSALKKGHTLLVIKTKNSKEEYEIIVGEKEKIDNNKFIKLDMYEAPFEWDLPPGVSK